jgi:hypothetical protein
MRTTTPSCAEARRAPPLLALRLVGAAQVREVTITPNSSWGGEGSLGCDIGRGILHRLPFAPRRRQARQQHSWSSSSAAAASSSSLSSSSAAAAAADTQPREAGASNVQAAEQQPPVQSEEASDLEAGGESPDVWPGRSTDTEGGERGSGAPGIREQSRKKYSYTRVAPPQARSGGWEGTMEEEEQPWRQRRRQRQQHAYGDIGGGGGGGGQPHHLVVTVAASAAPVDSVPAGLRTVRPLASRSVVTAATKGKECGGPAISAQQLRAAAAVVGAVVGDAATMGVHWIYDMGELAARLQHHLAAPEFHEPPACPYYEYRNGALSPYGDQALVVRPSCVFPQRRVAEFDLALYMVYLTLRYIWYG